jgi:hypothetical protein
MKKVIFGYLLVLLATAGCGGEKMPELVEVNGVVTLKYTGKPLDQIQVTFMPDPEKVNFGRSSTGVTNQNGEYSLKYGDKTDMNGAAVGWNRVVLSDIKAIESSRDENPIPRRFHSKYGRAAETTLVFEVAGGAPQTINIEVDDSEETQ